MLRDTISIELFYNTDYWKEHGEIFLHDGFFMLRSFNIAGREFLMPTQPYLLQEGRVVLVTQGHADYTFDLVDYHFQAGDLVVFYTETLIEKKSHSDDFQFDAFSFKSKRSEDSGRGFTCLHLGQQTGAIVGAHFSLLWALVHQQPLPLESVRLITDSLLQYVAQQETEDSLHSTHRDDILHRFLTLVSRHAAKERNIPFYAERLCIAPHYLSTLIKQQSGRTPMQWSNHTAIKEIKVWLPYSDETAAQIADHMAFPCPSSLTKFFKRETGMTPTEYRIKFKAKS